VLDPIVNITVSIGMILEMVQFWAVRVKVVLETVAAVLVVKVEREVLVLALVIPIADDGKRGMISVIL
jgi:hypothetical protein